jgi:hypothetical protein
VCLAHKGIANEADADFFLCHEFLLLAHLRVLQNRSATRLKFNWNRAEF